MAKKKVYAVRKGYKTGIFYTWDACKKATAGYSGAEFMSFPTKEGAEQYLRGGNPGELPFGTSVEVRENPSEIQIKPSTSGKKSSKVYSKEDIEAAIAMPEDGMIAYVDGSFDLSLGKYSFGCILLTPDGEITREFGNGDNPESLKIRNVAGEMLGSMFAVKWAMKKGYASIEIRYDYEGIEKWVTGAWRAKMEQTQKYAAYMQQCAQKIRITFCKVAAHTGDYFNEEADKLAKRGLVEGNGIPEI